MTGLTSDLRCSARILIRSPGLVVAVMLTLGVGIGAATALFSIVDGVLLRRLSLPEPERLVQVFTHFRGSTLSSNSEANLLDYGRRIDAFESVGAYAWGRRHISGADQASSILVVAVTPSFFDVLRTAPLQGRVLSSNDAVIGSPPAAVVISYGFWKSYFGGKGSALGTELLIEERPVQVVGIMPPSFRFPDPEVQAWLPLAIDPANPYSRENHYLRIIARLRDRVTVSQIQDEVAAYGEQIVQEFPDNYSTFEFGTSALPLQEAMVGSSRLPLLLLLGSVGLVLLIGCANIAGLLLVRADQRRRELAVRAALGASSGRLVRLVLAEGVLLSLAGGVAGLALARLGHASLLTLAADVLPRLDEVVIDYRVLGFGVLISLVAGALAALLPALLVTRTNVREVLQDAGRAISTGAGRQHGRRLLVAVEVALAVVLVAGAGLMLRSLDALLQVELGLRTDNVLTMWITLPDSREENVPALRELIRSIEEQSEALPGVRSAGIMRRLPVASRYGNWSIQIDGAEVDTIGEAPIAQLQQATPGALRTLGLETVTGRPFLGSDGVDSPPVALVNETFARTLMPGQPVVGERVRMYDPGSPWMEVVGVLRDTRDYGPEEAVQPMLIVPAAQMGANGVEPAAHMALLVHGEGDINLLAGPLREMIGKLDPAAVVRSVRTMAEVRSATADGRELPAVLLGLFSAVALVLAAIGIASMVAISITLRRREIGIRLALGADNGDVRRMLITQGLAPVMAGLAAGLTATLAVGHLLGELLFAVEPWDPTSLAVTAAVVGLVSLAVILDQCRRGAFIDPAKLLRTE
jgi:predicted permease